MTPAGPENALKHTLRSGRVRGSSTRAPGQARGAQAPEELTRVVRSGSGAPARFIRGAVPDDARTVSYRSAHFPEKRKISRAARRMKLTLGFHIAMRASRLAASPGSQSPARSPARAATRLPMLRNLRSMTSRLLAPPLGTARASAEARNAHGHGSSDGSGSPSRVSRDDLEC